MTLVLVRHAQQDGSPPAEQTDPPLSRLGARQARRVARRLATTAFDCIYGSDLRRAAQTAEAIRHYHRATPFRTDARLREIQSWLISPGRPPRRKGLARQLRQERRRVTAFCRGLLRKHRAGECVLIVAHGNLIRFMIWHLFGANPRTPAMIRTYHTSVSIMTLAEGGGDGRLVLADCVRHLKAADVTNWSATEA